MSGHSIVMPKQDSAMNQAEAPSGARKCMWHQTGKDGRRSTSMSIARRPRPHEHAYDMMVFINREIIRDIPPEAAGVTAHQ
mmetsp:Transcript_63423/g.138951  ORF Transcript_63423/g.138951 Transcript_63423/m.138951 type:complete len:81 (-) Transcript_63423:35-277(-)